MGGVAPLWKYIGRTGELVRRVNLAWMVGLGGVFLVWQGRGAIPPPPVQSGDGVLYVACRDAARADLRWPVLRFADTVRRHLGETFTPLGSAESPLSILLGSETNRVTTLRQQQITTADGFSQLVVVVPNPETVDLEALRTAIVEALLRECARGLKGSYKALTWPPWFVQGVVDAARGDVWQAEACERVLELVAAGRLPKVETFFSGGTPSREVAAFFAQWVIFLNRTGPAAGTTPESVRQLRALTVAPWRQETILNGADSAAWEAWVRAQGLVVRAPGLLTQAQFERWAAHLMPPQDVAAARACTDWLSRSAIGRPKPFRDLTELYLRAYAAYVTGNEAAYAKLWTEAKAAQEILAAHLRRVGVLEAEAQPVPVPAQRKTGRR